MAEVHGLSPRDGGRLALLCIHRMNRVYVGNDFMDILWRHKFSYYYYCCCCCCHESHSGELFLKQCIYVEITFVNLTTY